MKEINDSFKPYLGLTTNEDLAKVEKLMEGMDEDDNPFVSEISAQILNDDIPSWRDLYNVYADADAEGRAICDCLMVALCGCTFHTIIEAVEDYL